MEMYRVNFTGALSLIAQDFNISTESNPDYKPRRRENIPWVEIIFSRTSFEFEQKPFPDFGEPIDYWHQYGITIDILNEYHVKNIEWYSFISGKGRNVTRKAIPFYPIYLYDYNDDGEILRFYWPKSKTKANKWCGNTRFIYVF